MAFSTLVNQYTERLVYDSFCWILLQIEVGEEEQKMNVFVDIFSVNISLPMLCIWNLF